MKQAAHDASRPSSACTFIHGAGSSRLFRGTDADSGGTTPLKNKGSSGKGGSGGSSGAGGATNGGAGGEVGSKKRVLLAQYMLGQQVGGGSGDPAMALAVPTAQYRSEYLFHAPVNYEKNFVTITAPSTVTVNLDGAPVAGSVPVGNTDYSVTRIQLPNSNSGNHTVDSTAPVGITVYGYGQYTSYWYPGGLDLKIIKE